MATTTAGTMTMRLTRPGMWLLGVLAILLSMSMNYRNNATYLLFAVMSGCTLVAMLEARRNLRGLSLTVEALPPVFAGQRPRLMLRLAVPDRRPRHLLRLAIDAQDEILLSADDGSTCDLELPPRERGVHRLDSCRLSSSHPFGLVTVHYDLPINAVLLVYPQPAGERPLPGDNQAGERGEDQQDFAGHRRYQPGDAPQHIDWKVAARSGITLIKRFGGERNLHRHRLSLNRLTDLDLEPALSQLCRWVCLAEERREPYGLDTSPTCSDPDCGPEHHAHCLEALARHGS